MRQRGTLNDWNDDRGFGFIDPAHGGDRVFAHIKAFKQRGHRPSGGEPVTYKLDHDPRGRPRAEDIKIIGNKAPPRRSDSRSPRRRGGLPRAQIAVAFLGAVALATLAGYLILPVLGAYVVVSLVSFLAYGGDKRAAQSGRWRTPESTLHMLDLFCGWPGGLMAQKVFRHKSSKGEFQVMFWITVLLNVAILGWMFLNPETAHEWYRQLLEGMEQA